MKKIRILWVSPTLPIPVNAGNRRHLNYLIQMMKGRGAVVDFVLHGWEKEAALHHQELVAMFNRFKNVPDSTKKEMSYPDYWGIDDWVPNSLMSGLVDFVKGQTYDVVFVEYVWLSRVLDLFGPEVIKVIDSHDIFSDRDLLLESQGIEKQWYYTRQSQEVIGLSRADIVLGITQSDCDYFNRLLNQYGKKNTKILPCGTGIAKKQKISIKNQNIKGGLCLGYLASSNALNKDAAKRFFSTLNNYDIKKTNCYFNIGGSITRQLDDYKNLPIFKKGYVSDPEKFYADADIMLAPMVDGTGLKIKTVESIEYQKPFMATRQATNDIPVSSTWHTFPTVEVFADYLGRWLIESSDRATRDRTVDYLTHQSELLSLYLRDRQHVYEEKLLEELVGGPRSRSALPYLANQEEKRFADLSQSLKHPSPSTIKPSVAVSVIIPAYNTEKYIGRCLDSIVVDDMFSNVEVIVIDDGSTDGTLNVVSQYTERHRNIRVLQQSNSGQGVARNKGMDVAVGEYLYFVDSDDYLGKNALSLLYTYATKEDLDICSPDRPYLTERPLSFISALPGWCCFVKRSLLEIDRKFIRQPAIRSGQDGVFANMLLTRCRTSGVCVDANYYYEKREESTFNALKKDLSAIPKIVEQHLHALRVFYHTHKLFDSQLDRYLLFIQDETYKFRYMNHLPAFKVRECEHIFLAIKSELKPNIEKISSAALPYFKADFLAIASVSAVEHRGLYGS